MKRLGVLGGWVLWCAAIPGLSRADVSKLWGQDGEKWMASGRLPDFSRAGYNTGRSAIPEVPVAVNVKDFGARGDGVSDDSAAFQKALAANLAGAVFIPAGRYVLKTVLRVRAAGIVFRGEGPDKTVLYFPNSLSDIAGPTAAPGGSWSWSGGFLSFEGNNHELPVGKVAVHARRGSFELTLDGIAHVAVGTRVRLVETDTDGGLGRLLHANQADASSEIAGMKLVDFSARVESISGTTLRLDRPLRVDADPHWNAAVLTDEPTVQNAGVEHLAIEFPAVLYPGHHQEPGFNAIEFQQMADSWVRDVRITNADSGIFLRQDTRFCTVSDVVFTADPSRLRTGYGGDSAPNAVVVGGHHGILTGDLAQDNVIERFTMTFRFIHDLAVTSMAAGNVYSQGSGPDLCFDHHRKAPYENLFTDISAGTGARLWDNGGDTSSGPPSAARETFWNIRTDAVERAPPWAIETNVIGIVTQDAAQLTSTGLWLEPIAPGRLEPPNLYDGQRNANLAAAPLSSSVGAGTPAVQVAPNPWRADRHRGTDVTFWNVPPGDRVKIFTVSGHRVTSVIADSFGQAHWNLNNDAGVRVASGLYLYVTTSAANQTARGTVAVIR